LSQESSAVMYHRHTKTTPEAWQSWELAVRYLIVRLADTAPCAFLAWLAYVRH